MLCYINYQSLCSLRPQLGNYDCAPNAQIFGQNFRPLMSYRYCPRRKVFELCLRNIRVENVSHKAIKKKSYTNKIMCLPCLRPSYLEIMFVIARRCRLDTVDLPGIYENSPTITSLGTQTDPGVTYMYARWYAVPRQKVRE